VPIFGPAVYGLPCSEGLDSNSQAAVSSSSLASGRSQENPIGLIRFCLEELCRRVAEDRDSQRFCLGLSVWELCGSEAGDLLAAEGEDAVQELRFETVHFHTASEALSLIEASGIFAASDEEARESPMRNQQFATSAYPFSRHHLFVRAVVFDARKESLAALHFAWVAGEGKHDSIGQQVAADREALWGLLEAASTGEVPEPNGTSRLSEVLSPLIAGNCKPFFLCSVPERPSSKMVASEALSLLDLAESASLITAQCTRVQGVSQQHFQLAELDDVMRRVQQRSGSQQHRITHSEKCSPGFGARGQHGIEEPHTASSANPSLDMLAAASSSPERGHPGLVAEDEVMYDEVLTASTQLQSRSAYISQVADQVLPASAQLHSRGSPETTPRDESAAVRAAAAADVATRAGPWADVQEQCQNPVGAPPAPDCLSARAAHVACVEQCRELGKACVLLRAENEAKVCRRKQELRKVMQEVASLRESVAAYEDKCEAPGLLDTFRSEVRALQSEAMRLRDENAALAGAKGPERRRGAQSATLQALQVEASKVHQSVQDFEQGEKRAKLVRKCLSEVQLRYDIAKSRLQEVERELTDLEPAYGELGRQIEQSEKRRRWVQDELDKLRRASCGLRAEIAQLREVRATIDSLPPYKAQPQDCTTNNGVDSSERFAALQRRLAAVAPQLMPLCVRARSEMEELLRCCRNLEERQRRLQQVGSSADDLESVSGGLSRSSSAATGINAGTPRRRQARSSDATSRTASHHGSTSQLPPQPRPVGQELPPRYCPDPRPACSGRSTPRRSAAPFRTADVHHEQPVTPRSARSLRSTASQRSFSCNATPRSGTNAAATTPHRAAASHGTRGAAPTAACTTPRAPPAQTCPSTVVLNEGPQSEEAANSWISPRDGGGPRARSQEYSKDGRYSRKTLSHDRRDPSVEGTASALNNLGLHVQPGTATCVQGVHLSRPVVPVAKSRDGYSRGTTPIRSARSRSR